MDHRKEQKTINAKKDNNDQMEVEEERFIFAKFTVLANSKSDGKKFTITEEDRLDEIIA